MPDTPISSRPRQMACVSCTTTKRKCTKEIPACRRCAGKGSTCIYPSPKVTISLDALVSQEPRNFTCSDVEWVGPDNGTTISPRDQTNPPRPETAFSTPHAHAWFLSLDSWDISYRPTRHYPPSFGQGALHRFIADIRSWVTQWVTGGQCPFIHSCLYQKGTPSCIQDAFATTAAYLAKTRKTESFVLGIVESRTNGLLAEQAKALDDVNIPTLDTLGHLARTHALLVYQIMRIFDGDIRSRAQAELAMDILVSWASQMWESANLDIASISTSCSMADMQDCNGAENIFNTGGNVSSFWRAWYVAESVRRTFIIAVFLNSICLTLKQGWAACPGGVTFTARCGLWDATSPYDWLQVFHHDSLSPVQVQTIKSARLFVEARPADVDEFTSSILRVSHGAERFEQWVAEKADYILV